MELRSVIEKTVSGELSVDEAERLIRGSQYEDLGFAKIDHARAERQGQSEVVFCQGKPDAYLVQIFMSIWEAEGEVLGTRASGAQYELVRESISEVCYDPIARILKIEREKPRVGCVVVCTAGTSDIPVAEEAAQTAEFMGSAVDRIYDVGVAGIHRLFAQRKRLERARSVVAVAGMEGALPSVVAGLVRVPVIAVPTSVGYGASFGGLAALLGMLNSCSNGVSVVNIDNGYGAGYIANQINRAAETASRNPLPFAAG